MPVYQYECTGCKKVVECLQTIEEMQQGIDGPEMCEMGCKVPFDRLVGGASIGGLCDTSFWKAVRHTVEEFDDPRDDRGPVFRKMAEDAGVDLTGKVYMPMLAQEFGDPEAWVGSIGDIQNLCKRRGHTFHGMKDGVMKITMYTDFSKDIGEQIVRSEIGT